MFLFLFLSYLRIQRADWVTNRYFHHVFLLKVAPVVLSWLAKV